MALPFIHSTNSLFGIAYTGFRGLILGGSWSNSTSVTGPAPIRSGIAVVQPGAACSASGVASQVLSTVPASFAFANFVWIPQSTGTISTSSDAAGSGGTSTGFGSPNQSGMGAALIWNAGASKIGVFSTVSQSWMYTAALTSSA